MFATRTYTGEQMSNTTTPPHSDTSMPLLLVKLTHLTKYPFFTYLFFVCIAFRTGINECFVIKYSTLNLQRNRADNDIFSPTCTSLVSLPPNLESDDNREALRFVFKGYTLWLELEQFPLEINPKEDGTCFTTASDLDHIIALAASEQGLQPIPMPHVTLLYGMCQYDTEEEVKAVFNGKLRDTLASAEINNSTSYRSSTLQFHDGRFGVAFDGVDGEDMDMAWTEITYNKSPEYDKMVEIAYQIFYGKQQDKEQKWGPHLSLAYDNPEDTILTSAVLDDLIARFPTLKKERKVKAISLWDTHGSMSNWKFLDRISLENASNRKI